MKEKLLEYYMRFKEPCYVISFHTTADAIAFERQAQADSFPGRQIPLPRAISAGCGMAWKMRQKDFPDLRDESVAALGIVYDQIYELSL